MRQNDLHLLLACITQHPNPLKRSFRPLDIAVDATRLPFRILPHRNAHFARKYPPIVAGIAGQIDPFAGASPGEDVCVAFKVARRVNEVEATVVEKVDGVREMR